MEDKNKNPIENTNTFSAGENPTPNPLSQTPIPNPVSPPPSPSPVVPPQNNEANIPTPPPTSSSGGKGSTIIVGGILLLFVAIVIALYFLILRQASQPEVQITPPAIERPITEVTPTPVNTEEEDVINVELEENLDEEFAPIDQDTNQL